MAAERMAGSLNLADELLLLIVELQHTLVLPDDLVPDDAATPTRTSNTIETAPLRTAEARPPAHTHTHVHVHILT